MSREFNPLNQYVGEGNLAVYAFDFRIIDTSQLLIVVLDDNDDEVYRVRGDDTTVFVQEVEIDTEDGGGTVTLLADLPTDYTMYFFMADDEPAQDQEYRNNRSFSLLSFERALDRVYGALTRAMWLARRSIRLHDTFDNETGTTSIDAPVFDMQLPRTIADSPSGVLSVNSDGDGLTVGSTEAEIIAAAAAAAVEAVVAGTNDHGPFSITEGQAAAALSGMTINSATYKSKYFIFTIVRGTTVFASGWLKFHYRNGTWYCLQLDDDRDASAVAHGVTFSFSGTSTAQITAAVATDGAGDGTIDLKEFAVLAS